MITVETINRAYNIWLEMLGLKHNLDIIPINTILNSIHILYMEYLKNNKDPTNSAVSVSINYGYCALIEMINSYDSSVDSNSKYATKIEAMTNRIINTNISKFNL
jgi:hypothetical protein